MNMITNIILIFLMVLMIAIMVTVVIVYNRIKSSIMSFITPAKEGEPSPMALAIDAASSIMARSMVAQIKTTFMGLSSGAVRGEKAIQGALVEDMAMQNPLAGALMSMFPKLSKSLKRNPALMDVALNYLQSRGQVNPQAVGSNGQGTSPKFKL